MVTVWRNGAQGASIQSTRASAELCALRHLGAYATAAQAVRVRARFVLRVDVARHVLPEKFAPRFSETLTLDSLH